jgi:hypothetical protein
MAPFYGKPRPRIAIACGIIQITIDLVAVTLRRMRNPATSTSLWNLGGAS